MQGLPARVALQDASQQLRLSSCLRAALRNAPRLAAARERVLAREAAVSAAGSLPDPRLGLSWFAEPIRTRTGDQRVVLSLSQLIPWPAKLAAQSDAASAQAQVARAQERMAASESLAGVSRSYFELAYLQDAGEITAEVLRLADEIVAAALSGGASGVAMEAELVRAQSERARLHYDEVVLAELAQVQRAQLAAAVDRDLGDLLGRARLPAAPAWVAAFEEVLAVARRSSPKVQLARAGIAVAEGRQAAARAEFGSDLSFGLAWIGTESRDLGGLRDDGADPVRLDLSASLPIQRSAKHARLASATHQRREAAWLVRAAERELEAQLQTAIYRVRDRERALRLYRETIVPQAAAAARSARKLHEERVGSLVSATESLVAWHHHRLATRRALADLWQALADLEALAGVPLRSEGAP